MGRLSVALLAFLLYGNVILADKDEESTAKAMLEGERNIAKQILTILEHYKQKDPVGFPGAKIPDPMPIPDMKHTFSMANMNFQNVQVYELSKFRIKHVKSEISQMKVNAAMTIEVLYIKGDYTMTLWFKKAKGPFTVVLKNVYIEGTANLGVERDGRLQAQDIKMDISFSKIDMNFQNLGIMGTIFQGILNSVGNFLFDSVKPFVLKEAYVKIRGEINSNLDKVAGDIQFSNSISPLDMVVAETRGKIRDMKLDPFMVEDYNYTKDFYKAKLSHTWLMGVSSFYRVGDMAITMQNNTMFVDFEIGTQKLEGQTQWEISFVGGLMSRAGTASFSVDYINVRVIVAQSLDTRNRPQMKNFDLEVGNIQVRFDGAGTLDYVIELAINVLPNLLRYQIVDAIEGPIMEKIQEKFNEINVEAIIKDKVATLNDEDAENFKLSSLKDFQMPSKDLFIKETIFKNN